MKTRNLLFLLAVTFSLVIQSQINAIKNCHHALLNSNTASQLNSTIDTRSDSIDILKYTIQLDITDFTTKTIKGNTAVNFKSKVNGLTKFKLDLLKLTIDSIKQNNAILNYTYNDTLISIDLLNQVNQNNTSIVIIYYRGKPQSDATWGGFYFQGQYAYNMGVGFDAKPHNFGRVWYPCIDNFIERATYHFNIKTNGGKVAYCNGTLSSDTTDINGNRYRAWDMLNEIPTYLSCVAVAPYTEVKQIYSGLQNNIPIVLAAVSSDTSNLKLSFANLPSALNTFEKNYGPYLWQKVGYSVVPFSSGAMEHATNIMYPQYTVDGTLADQHLMAHELAHSWWGNLITCASAEDMWINEGMASYSEHLFEEGLYGVEAYKSIVRKNHEYVMHYTHILDNSYQAISGIPHNITYGSTVYNKGASVAHSLRGYLGDALFFSGIKTVMNNYQYKHIDSYTLRDELQLATGKNLTDFFNDWVFNPGFAHFSIDSFQVVKNGMNYDVTTFIKQKLTGTTQYYNNVPMTITIKDSLWNEFSTTANLSTNYSTITFQSPIKPVFTGINLDEKLNHAVAPDLVAIKNNGTYTLSNARISIAVNNIIDSAFIFAEHNFAPPDNFKTQKNIKISPYHYWKLSGITPTTFYAKATFTYDGRTTTANNAGYFDKSLIIGTEDSLVLLYRENAADDWALYPYYTKTMGSKFDKFGTILVDSLKMGEYTFGMKVAPTAVSESKHFQEQLCIIKPNPASDYFDVELLKNETAIKQITLINTLGQQVLQINHPLFQNNIQRISNINLPSGIYFIQLEVLDNNQTKNTILHHSIVLQPH